MALRALLTPLFGRLLAPLRYGMDRWLFRLGQPEQFPIRLGQRRIFVLPTAAGYAFAVALVVMLIASINYNLSLGYGLVFLLTGIGIVSIFHAFRNLLHLSISPGRADPVFAGEMATFSFIVSNARNLARPALRISSSADQTLFALAPEATASVALRCASARRGWLLPGRITLETRYPLGLVRAWAIFIPDVRCLVYPAPEQAPPVLPEASSVHAGGRPGRSGDGDFAGLSAHQLSDSPRHVAWKVVARGGPMMTKRFSGHEGGEYMLDWYTLPDALATEARLSRLAAWVLGAGTQGRPFALRLPSSFDAAGVGQTHTHACLKRLALHGASNDEQA